MGGFDTKDHPWDEARELLAFVLFDMQLSGTLSPDNLVKPEKGTNPSIDYRGERQPLLVAFSSSAARDIFLEILSTPTDQGGIVFPKTVEVTHSSNTVQLKPQPYREHNELFAPLLKYVDYHDSKTRVITYAIEEMARKISERSELPHDLEVRVDDRGNKCTLYIEGTNEETAALAEKVRKFIARPFGKLESYSGQKLPPLHNPKFDVDSSITLNGVTHLLTTLNGHIKELGLEPIPYSDQLRNSGHHR